MYLFYKLKIILLSARNTATMLSLWSQVACLHVWGWPINFWMRKIWGGHNIFFLERPTHSTIGYSHCFGLVVVVFKFAYCHPGFDVITTLLMERSRSGIWWRSTYFWGLMSVEGQSAFYDSGKRSCVKNKEYRSEDWSLWNTDWDGNWLRSVAMDTYRLGTVSKVWRKSF